MHRFHRGAGVGRRGLYPVACIHLRDGLLVAGRCSAPEVSVPLGPLAWVDVGWRDEPGDPGVDLGGPLFLVDEVVVMGAEQGSVVCTGGSAV